VWLRSKVVDGAVSLADTGGTSRLYGRLTDAGVTGTLSVDGRQWGFTAGPVGSDRGQA
jgi:hypothetical protein